MKLDDDSQCSKNLFFVKNLKEMRDFSKKISKLLQPGSFLLLFGDLGAGKTTLTKLISVALGIKQKVNSPTFNILKQYWIKDRNCFLNHFDFFNLKNDENISFFEDFKKDNINIVEWPNVNRKFWEAETKNIFISIFIVSNDVRKIELKI